MVRHSRVRPCRSGGMRRRRNSSYAIMLRGKIPPRRVNAGRQTNFVITALVVVARVLPLKPPQS